MGYFVYLLRCADSSLYTGVTTDLARRFAEHSRGVPGGGAKYTAAHTPLRIAAAWTAPDRSAAQRLEYRLKALDRAQKERLISGGALPPFDAPAPLFCRVAPPEPPIERSLSMLFLCYPSCSTCRRALAFLKARGLEPTVRNIRTEPPQLSELRAWQSASGLALSRFFNTSGAAYRRLELAKRLPSLSDEEALALLSSDGMLVRRPLLIAEGFVLVGFRVEEWEARFPAAEPHA